MSFDINWASWIVTGIVFMIIGGLWYSPILFGKQWMKLMGFSAADMEKGKKNMPAKYIGNFIATLILLFVFVNVLAVFGAETVGESIGVAFWTWLGFIGAITVGGVFWKGESWTLWLINNAYWLVSLIVGAIILSVWP